MNNPDNVTPIRRDKGSPVYVFRKDMSSKPLGTLIIDEDGELAFEGEVDRSAQIFFDTVIALNSEAMATMRTQLEIAHRQIHADRGEAG